MAQSRVRINQVLRTLRGSQRLAESVIMGRQLERAALEVARTARLKAPQHRGDLARSIMHQRIGLTTYRVAPGQQYAAYVESGTQGGGWPSKEAISEWIRVKRIHPRVDMTRDEFIYLIRRKIYRKGSPKQPFMRPALEENRARITQLLGAGVRAELRRLGVET